MLKENLKYTYIKILTKNTEIKLKIYAKKGTTWKMYTELPFKAFDVACILNLIFVILKSYKIFYVLSKNKNKNRISWLF